MLELPAQIYSEILAHARAGLPHEACGQFAGSRDSRQNSSAVAQNSGDGKGGGIDSAIHVVDKAVRVEKFFPMTNAAASEKIYRLDGLEMLQVEDQAETEGLSIIGVMHSHTHTTAYPSPTDVADAARFDPFGTMHFIIVSLKHPEPQLRSYRIRSGKIFEEEVRLC